MLCTTSIGNDLIYQTALTTVAQLRDRPLALVSTPLKSLIRQVRQVLWPWTKSYLRRNPVLGEGVQLSPSSNPSITNMPKFWWTRQLVIGSITSGKKKKLPLKRVDPEPLADQAMGGFYHS